MHTSPLPPSPDPAVEAARINRNGAIIAAVITALVTAVATGTGAFLLGRERGESTASAATVTVTAVHTETATVTAGQADVPNNSAPPAQPGPTTLLDLAPLEPDGEWRVEDRKVNTKEYEDALTAPLDDCSGNTVSQTYQIDRKYQRFRAEVGLTDDSGSDARVEIQFLVDNTPNQPATVTIGPGTLEQVDVDISNAFRITIAAQTERNCTGDFAANVAWLNTSLT